MDYKQKIKFYIHRVLSRMMRTDEEERCGCPKCGQPLIFKESSPYCPHCKSDIYTLI